MVFGLHLQRGPRLPILRSASGSLTAVLALLAFAGPASARADRLNDARNFADQGLYFRSAQSAFEAAGDPSRSGEAYSIAASSLFRAGLYHASTYFFIKTLQSGDRAAIRRVLVYTEDLVLRVGPDLIRRYLIRHTKYQDYDARNRSAFLYVLGKHALLIGKESLATGYFDAMEETSALWPYALQLRGSAHAITGDIQGALRDFRLCQKESATFPERLERTVAGMPEAWSKNQKEQAWDLQNRCIAGEARTLYQAENFDEADRVYDRIPKASYVWTDILFEQAWSSFSKQEYNRTLGKLVSYKSPQLQFVFNSEVEVLRAQTYLALCLYGDADKTIREFYSNYTRVAEDVKHYVEADAANLKAFYENGKAAARDSLHTAKPLYRLMNRFVRAPYFRSLVESESLLQRELAGIRSFSGTDQKGFSGFLNLVLGWRLKTIQQLGGSFVRNGLMDYHSILISDFDKMSFLRLELLNQAKNQLLAESQRNQMWAPAGRTRGNIEPKRRDDQYFWSFNGEFWIDEIGDYVFGLESQCGRGSETAR